MHATTDTAPVEAADRSAPIASLRKLEAEVLLGAVHALRVAGVLTDDEYEAKRRRLAAQL